MAAEDVGNIINPMIVHGQIHGGLVQGIGRALFEECVYEAEGGYLQTAFVMEYAVPRATNRLG